MGLFSKKAPPVEKSYTASEVDALVSEALVGVANEAQGDSIRGRMASMLSGSYDFGDTLHNVYIDYGYPFQLTFSNLWNMYRRLGIAKNVVELVPDTGWMTTPEVKGSDQFNRDLEIIEKRLKFWQRMKGLDTRQRVGRYAGFFMRVKDGKKPHLPLESKLTGQAALVDIIPLYESQLKVLTTDNDILSDDFGKPSMYQFSSGVSGNRDPMASGSFSIHPSRIVIASEDSDNGGIYGISVLEACFNSLMDVRKIIGGGAEGFYKNASQSVIFELSDTSSAVKNEKALDGFNERFDDWLRNRFLRGLWTPGLKPTQLESHLIEPTGFFMIALNDVAASAKIPVTILIGQMTGRLASDEDSKAFLSTVQSRRINFMTEMVRDTIDWCLEWGILPASEYEVEWDDLLALSDKERIANAKEMAETNKFNAGITGGGLVYKEDEIRDAAGLDPEDLPEPDESLEDEDLDDDD